MKLMKWFPVEGIPKTLYVEAVYDDYEGFRILLRGDSTQDSVLRLSFDPVVGFLNVDEQDRIATFNDCDTFGWSLFRVEESNFIAWLINESSGVRKPEELIHYAIYTPNDCLDIITSHAPMVSWLN